MQVWYHVFRPDSLTYTIARALAEGGYQTQVCVSASPQQDRPPDRIERHVYAIPGVSVIAARDVDPAATVERLVVQSFPRPAESLSGIGRLARCAERITLVSAGDRSRSLTDALKLQWLEVRQLGKTWRRVDHIVYKDGFHSRDLHGLLRRRAAVGFDVHSQFLQDPSLFGAIHARDWQPEDRRPILASFLGSQDPRERMRILDGIRHLFGDRQGALRLPAGKTVLWHEYSDAAPHTVPPADFVKTLTESDFTLCPRGYSLVTHRPIEALLRGSVPVLAQGELDLYGIPLQDGLNCIAVREGRWAACLEMLAGIDESDLVRMRRAILAMFGRELAYGALARNIRARVGITEPPG